MELETPSNLPPPPLFACLSTLEGFNCRRREDVHAAQQEEEARAARMRDEAKK